MLVGFPADEPFRDLFVHYVHLCAFLVCFLSWLACTRERVTSPLKGYQYSLNNFK